MRKLQNDGANMTNLKAVKELTVLLKHDRKALADLQRRETQLLRSISTKEFREGQERRQLLAEMEQLQNSINKNERMIEFAKK